MSARRQHVPDATLVPLSVKASPEGTLTLQSHPQFTWISQICNEVSQGINDSSTLQSINHDMKSLMPFLPSFTPDCILYSGET